MKTAEDVLDYWFGVPFEQQNLSQQRAQLWFLKNPSIDQEIEDLFFPTLQAASEGCCEDWKKSPKGYLALIIVLDQFARNIHRDSFEAFSYDQKALELAIKGMDAGIDQKLPFIMRLFFYMPLQHSEELAIQKKSIVAFYQLAKAAPETLAESLMQFHKYAVAHHNVIEKFGRFPHRNALLGRPSTQDEILFLRENGGF